jgi:uncharacterized protein
VVLVVLLPFLMLRWFEHHQVYHPSRHLVATGAELNRAMEEVWIQTPDGVRLHAWFYPGDGGGPGSGKTWLLLHGNAGNISHRLSHAAVLLETGAAAFLLDYRGYGRSRGRPSEAGTYLDAQAAYAWLRERGFQPAQILAVGESLGGGVATELARRETLGGLVLLSSFTSVPDLGAELFPWLPVRWLASIRYDSIAKLPDLSLPVLIIHSRADSLVRFHHAERNFAAARDPKWLREIAGDHNDTLESGLSAYRTALGEFLGHLAAAAGPDASPVHRSDESRP